MLKVLSEGPHHLVVFKPANTVVVAGRGAPRPTLLDLAKQQFGDKIRPVHRLDRGTSGLLLFAKSLFGQQALSDAFRKHLIQKRYLAICEGRPKFDKLQIDFRLDRVDQPNAKKGPLAHQTISDQGKRALTQVEVLSRSDQYCVILATPKTGRMHQIRIHLSHVGHPIVGDAQYGATTPFGEHAIALLAYSLSFRAPSGEHCQVICPLPAEFTGFLKQHNLGPLALNTKPVPPASSRRSGPPNR